MRPFRWERPTSVDEAVELLHDRGDDGQAIAGGQSLLLAMKARQAQPGCLISLGGLDDLSGIKADGPSVRVGPTTTYADLARSHASGDGVLGHVAGVTARIADTAVRSMATVGGAACQADPAFDVPVLLTACDASFSLISALGSREASSDEFFLGPGVTTRRADELLSSISLPRREDVGYGFAKFGLRAHDAALASVAVAVQLGEDGLREIRIVVGGCVERPTRSRGTEGWLVGQTADLAVGGIGEAVAEEIKPTISTTPFSADYRRRLLTPLSRRALTKALEGVVDQP